MFLSIQTMLVVKLQNNKTIWFNYQGNNIFLFLSSLFFILHVGYHSMDPKYK